MANQLHPESSIVAEGSDRFGRSCEQFVINEVRAFLAYERLDHPISFWRTSSGFEVDLIIGDMELAITCKSTREIRTTDLKGCKSWPRKPGHGARSSCRARWGDARLKMVLRLSPGATSVMNSGEGS